MILSKKQPAGIQYLGESGASAPCKDAVMRFLQFGDKITRVQILSNANNHCLLLNINDSDLVAVKSGFSSGYPGEGPHTLALVLQLLEAHGSEIEEYDVDRGVINRIDKSCLTIEDLDNLKSARPVRPSRWYGYILDHQKDRGVLWQYFPPVIPLAVIDSRIADLCS